MDESFCGTEQIFLGDKCSTGDQTTTSDDSIAQREAYLSADISGSVQFSGIFLRDFTLDLDEETV